MFVYLSFVCPGFTFNNDNEPQSSINWVGLTKPLTTSLNPISKHSSHFKMPSKGGRGRGRGEVGITGYQPTFMLGGPAWYKKLKQQTFENNSDRCRTNLDPFEGVFRLPSGNNNES